MIQLIEVNNISLSNEIKIIVQDEIKQIPYPIRCKITKVHSTTRVDIKSDIGELTQVECIANNPTVDNTGILVFTDGTTDNPIVITK